MRYVPPTIGLQCRRVLLRRSLQASLLVCVGVLVGCASRPNVPQAQRIVVPEFYIVQRGDTLGGIAARFGLDYRELGRANQVDNNYTIYADQRLRLRGLNQPPRVRILTPQGSTTSAIPLASQQLPPGSKEPARHGVWLEEPRQPDLAHNPRHQIGRAHV